MKYLVSYTGKWNRNHWILSATRTWPSPRVKGWTEEAASTLGRDKHYGRAGPQEFLTPLSLISTWSEEPKSLLLEQSSKPTGAAACWDFPLGYSTPTNTLSLPATSVLFPDADDISLSFSPPLHTKPLGWAPCHLLILLHYFLLHSTASA